MSVVFEWNPADFQKLVELCEFNTINPFVFKFISKDGLVLEAGCGLGQYVKFLQTKGYRVKGIEINENAVAAAKQIAPELDIIAGDVANLPYDDNSFDSVLSLGVVEHFVEGPEQALVEMHRVLKPGGVALVCVPCFNGLRQIKRYTGLGYAEYYVRKVYHKLRRRPVDWIYEKQHVKSKKFRFNRWPILGNFFEYRFKPSEFDKLLAEAGFAIKERAPIDFYGGLLQELGGIIVSQKNFVKPNMFVKFLHWFFSLIPYFHNHMYLVIVEKKIK